MLPLLRKSSEDGQVARGCSLELDSTLKSGHTTNTGGYHHHLPAHEADACRAMKSAPCWVPGVLLLCLICCVTYPGLQLPVTIAPFMSLSLQKIVPDPAPGMSFLGAGNCTRSLPLSLPQPRHVFYAPSVTKFQFLGCIHRERNEVQMHATTWKF